MKFSTKRFAEIISGLSPTAEESPIRGHDKRRATRVGLRTRLKIVLVGRAGTQTPTDIELRDLSARGLRFVYEKPLNRGEQFVLALPCSKGGAVPVLCTVAHCEQLWSGGVSIGAEFTCVLPKRDDQNTHEETKRISNSILE